MRIITFLSLILISSNFLSQSSQIDIDWFGDVQYNIGNISLIVPNSKNFKNNYSYRDYYRVVKQWESDRIIDESSVEISNIIYSDIDISDYNGLEKINFSKEANFRFNSSISKNKIFSFLELDPIIFDDGKYKIVESFIINYRFSERPKNNKNSIQSSVMRNGDWYQFYIQESGIHKIDRNFLENLGVNLVGVGDNKFNNKYLLCNKGKNINDREKHYSELTFHYWFWKNQLSSFESDQWIGFCQKRRFWIRSKKKYQ